MSVIVVVKTTQAFWPAPGEPVHMPEPTTAQTSADTQAGSVPGIDDGSSAGVQRGIDGKDQHGEMLAVFRRHGRA